MDIFFQKSTEALNMDIFFQKCTDAFLLHQRTVGKRKFQVKKFFLHFCLGPKMGKLVFDRVKGKTFFFFSFEKIKEYIPPL